MGKKTPKYIVFNKNMGGRFHKPVSGGDDLELLRTYYNGLLKPRKVKVDD